MVTLKQKNAINDALNTQIMSVRRQMKALESLSERVTAKLISLHDDERKLQEIDVNDIELKKLRTKAIKSLGTAASSLEALQRINSAMRKNFNKQLRLLRTQVLP